MMEQEGVIKYSFDYQHKPVCANAEIVEDINDCRAVMITQALIGQDEQRYGGYGFGNISVRSHDSDTSFLITGSQTGHLPVLTTSSLSCITDINVEQNKLCAYGEVEPSSESMTHGALYQKSKLINAIVHVHSPDIWRQAEMLNLASTAKEIPYGTPEMAYAVQQLSAKLMLGNTQLPILFVMKGHEDGVVAAGMSLAQCTNILLETLKRSKQIV